MTVLDPESVTLTILGGDDISAAIQNVSMSFTDRGDGELKFTTLKAGAVPALLSIGAKILVSDAIGDFHLFRIETDSAQTWTGGQQVQYTARGLINHGGDDVFEDKKIWLEGTNIGRIFNETLEICPQIGGVVDVLDFPATTEDTTNYQGQHPNAVWQFLSGLSGGTSAYQYQVLLPGAIDQVATPTGSTPIFRARAITEGAYRYKVRMDHGALAPAAADLQQVWNKVVVIWKDIHGATQRAIAQDNTSQANVGAIRARTYNHPEIDQAPDASYLANVYLSRLSNLQNAGGPLEIPHPVQVYDNDLGLYIPLWRVLAGEGILVEDFYSGDVALSNIQYLVSCTWNERARKLTCQSTVRNNLLESIGRGLKQKQVGSPDRTNSALVPDPGKDVSPGQHYDKDPAPGSTLKDVKYSPVDHDHGTPKGDITQGVTFSAFPQQLSSGVTAWAGLIRGTWTHYVIRAKGGPGVGTHAAFRVKFPDDQEFLWSGTDGATGTLEKECTTVTTMQVTLEDVGEGTTGAAIILHGTRNLTITDPVHNLAV